MAVISNSQSDKCGCGWQQKCGVYLPSVVCE